MSPPPDDELEPVDDGFQSEDDAERERLERRQRRRRRRYEDDEPREQDIGQDAGMRMLLPVGRSGLAITAGYLGLFSFLCLPIAPLAIVLGFLAISDIRKNPKKHGMGRAIFGIVMGIIGTLVMLIVAIVLLVQSTKRGF